MATTKRQQARITKKRNPRSKHQNRELEEFVRAGVERFLLQEVTIAEFLQTIRTAAKRESIAPHQLTRSVFSQIVKQAIKKQRQQARTKGSHHQPRGRKNAKATHRRD